MGEADDLMAWRLLVYSGLAPTTPRDAELTGTTHSPVDFSVLSVLLRNYDIHVWFMRLRLRQCLSHGRRARGETARRGARRTTRRGMSLAVGWYLLLYLICRSL